MPIYKYVGISRLSKYYTVHTEIMSMIHGILLYGGVLRMYRNIQEDHLIKNERSALYSMCW